jgi:hypothetical protein
MGLQDTIKQEFDAAVAAGWLPAFENAAQTYNFPVALLMAIASRETNMRNIEGDFHDGEYHGYGLMQVDIGSFPNWVKSDAWRDPLQSIAKGAGVLDGKRTEIEQGQGKTLTVEGRSFVGRKLDTADQALQVATACYNCGLWGYYAFSKGEPIDSYTTGKNYSTDVWLRKAFFTALLPSAPASPSVETPTDVPSLISAVYDLQKRVAALEALAKTTLSEAAK